MRKLVLFAAVLITPLFQSCCLIGEDASPAKQWVVADRAHHTFFEAIVEDYVVARELTPAQAKAVGKIRGKRGRAKTGKITTLKSGKRYGHLKPPKRYWKMGARRPSDYADPEHYKYPLVFRGPRDTLLPQRIYRFEHESIGDLDVFIVPIGPDDEGMLYEAVFN